MSDEVCHMTAKSDTDPFRPVRDADPKVQEVVKAVLVLERERLHQKRTHLVDDITELIKRKVQ